MRALLHNDRKQTRASPPIIWRVVPGLPDTAGVLFPFVAHLVGVRAGPEQ